MIHLTTQQEPPINEKSLVQTRLDDDQEYIKILRKLLLDLETECSIMRQLAKQLRDEAASIRHAAVGDITQYAMLVSIQDKVESLYSKYCLTEEVDMTKEKESD